MASSILLVRQYIYAVHGSVLHLPDDCSSSEAVLWRNLATSASGKKVVSSTITTSLLHSCLQAVGLPLQSSFYAAPPR